MGNTHHIEDNLDFGSGSRCNHLVDTGCNHLAGHIEDNHNPADLERYSNSDTGIDRSRHMLGRVGQAGRIELLAGRKLRQV